MREFQRREEGWRGLASIAQGAGCTACWNDEQHVPFEDNVHVLLRKVRDIPEHLPSTMCSALRPSAVTFLLSFSINHPHTPLPRRCSQLGPEGLSRAHLLNEGIICRERLLIKGMLMTSQRTEQPRMDPADIVNKGTYNNATRERASGQEREGQAYCELSLYIPHPGTPTTLSVPTASFRSPALPGDRFSSVSQAPVVPLHDFLFHISKLLHVLCPLPHTLLSSRSIWWIPPWKFSSAITLFREDLAFLRTQQSCHLFPFQPCAPLTVLPVGLVVSFCMSGSLTRLGVPSRKDSSCSPPKPKP